MKRKAVAVLQYRRQRGGPTGWNDLPQDPFDLIFAKLWHEPTFSSIIASLRLVSRAWREAVNQSPWKIQCQVKRSRTLEGLCKALPSVANLTVKSSMMGAIRLDPLLSLTGLTSMQLEGYLLRKIHYPAEPYVDLGYLPLTLQTLSMETVFVDPDSFNRMKCTKITQLHIFVKQNIYGEIAELLSHLPALRILSILWSAS